MGDETGRDHARLAGRRVLITLVAMAIAAAVAIAIGLTRHFRGEPGPQVEGEIDDAALSEPTRLCTAGSEAPCRSAAAIERFLGHEALVIAEAEAAAAGAQGAIALALEGPDGTRLRAKWRTEGSASLTNEPINELAAHRLQTLVLAPEDYVVPPAVARCWPLADYRAAVDPEAEPFEGTECVLGYLSYWLVGSTNLTEGREAGVFPSPPRGARAWDTHLYDPERFEAEPAYRRAFANVNLLTFLSANGDAHAGQFLFYEAPLHLFVVDSSMAFRVPTNPRMNLRAEDLGESLLAPSLPAAVAERARGLTPALVQQLLVLAEFRQAEGVLRPVAHSEPFDTQRHVRREGDRLQLGLTSAEVGPLWNRITELQRRLADGELGTF